MIIAVAAAGQKTGTPADATNYDAQASAPKNTRRIVFIASKADHGPRGNHEFFAGSLYMARIINSQFKNAFAVVYDEKIGQKTSPKQMPLLSF